MKIKNCPACKSAKIKFVFDTQNKDYSKKGYKYFQCLNCNGLFLNPIPNEKQISSFYGNENLNNVTSLTTQQLKKKWLNKNRFADDHEQYIIPLLRHKRSGKLLDFGSGEGWFVHHASLNGFDATGMDVDKSKITKGSKIFQGKFVHGDSLDSFDSCFDVVSLLSILEHVQDPNQLLKQVSKVLKKSGIVMIVVPTVDSLQYEILKHDYYWFMAPHHINLFSFKGLEKLLQKNSFVILSKHDIEKNWYWTRVIVQKLGIQKQYEKWRKDKNFVSFDIELDKILDQIAFDHKKSSAMLVFAKKK